MNSPAAHGVAPANLDTGDAPKRRTRRTEAELRRLILDSARHEFSRNGYDATTTKAIAARAGVSESLLFRYFGPKSALLEAAAIAPFNALIEGFQSRYFLRDSAVASEIGSRHYVRDLTQYLRDNRLLIARLMSPSPDGAIPGGGAKKLHDYFDRAAHMVAVLNARAGQEPDPGVALRVRLSFGMVLSSILFSDWLFEEAPGFDELVEALEGCTTRLL